MKPLDRQVTISIASMPSRETGLLEVVRRLLPQCDRMNICLNDYPFTPKELLHPKITLHQPSGEDALSDHGKFFWCRGMLGYHLTADDDIIYPWDYVETLVRKIDQYQRRAVVSFHGSRCLVAEGRLINYPYGRQLIRFGDTIMTDVTAHMLGTGVGGYHTSLLNWDYTMIPEGGTDEHLAMYAQAHKIPMILAAHRTGWILDNRGASMQDPIHARRNIQQKMINMLCGYKRWVYTGEELLNENNSPNLR